jgi:hypothetical protein
MTHYLAAITLPDGTVIPSDPSPNPNWAGIGPGSIPYIGNQTPGAGGHSGMEPGALARYFGWGVPTGGGKPRPNLGPGWGPQQPYTGIGPAGPCGPGTNDPNCTGGVPVTVLHPNPPVVPISCPTGQFMQNGVCVTQVVENPPYTAPTSPRTGGRHHRAQIPQHGPTDTSTGDVCPLRGYVSRPIPGAAEYQNFKCTPGQPVTIDRGMAAAGAAGAYQRQGGGPSIWTGQAGGWGPGTAFYNPRPRWSHPELLGDVTPVGSDPLGLGLSTIDYLLLAGAAAFLLLTAKKKGRR